MTRSRLRLDALEARLTPTNSPELILDIANGSSSSNPTAFAGIGGTAYFAAAGSSGDELWKTDGTTVGTASVIDLFPGGAIIPNSSSPRNLTAVGTTLFFTATDGSTGIELYKSDGTAGGTVQVEDIRLGANSSAPARLTAVGSLLYFTATDAAAGTELWKSDGTADGTALVGDLTPGSAATDFLWLKVIGGKLYFARKTGLASNPLIDVYGVGPGGIDPVPVVSYTATTGGSDVAVLGTRLFYHAFTPDQKDTLFVADLAAPVVTSVPLMAAPTNVFGANRLSQLTAAAGKLYFSADTAVGVEPWVSDGTPGETGLLKDISQDTPQNNPSSSPTEFTAVGGTVYFAAGTIAAGRELWRTDGTENGTFQVADIEPGDTSSSPSELISVGGRLVFDTFVPYVTTLRAYNPATGQLASFPGHGLFQGSPLGAIYYGYGVHNDVLYMGERDNTVNLGVELYKLEFDPAPPVITGFDPDTGVPGDGVTSDPTPRLFGTATANIRVRVYYGPTLVGSTTATADGEWEVTTTALADGPHSLKARTVNLNGTESADSLPLDLTIDTTVPAAPAITAFADNTGDPTDNVTGDNTPTLDGTAEPLVTVFVFDGGQPVGNVQTGADGQWSLPIPTRTDGGHDFTARALDAAGNMSPASSPFTVVIDTAAPGTPAITGFAPDTGVVGDELTNDATPTLSGTAEPGTTVEVSDGPMVLGTASVGPGGDWQFTPPTALADGPHSFTATAFDVAGNPSPPSAPLALTIDTVRPTVTINTVPGQLDPTNVPPISFKVTFSKPVTGFTAAGVDLSGSTVGGTLVADVTVSGNEYTVTVTGMTGDGDVIASILADAAVDVAGNGNTASTSIDNTVRFDAIAPSATIDQAAGQADPTDESTLTFTVRFSEPVTDFAADDVSFAGSTSPGTLAAQVTGSGADYTVTVTGMTGAQTVVVSIPAGAAVDAAGNTSLASTSSDNVVTFNDIGVLQFNLDRFDTIEGATTAQVTVSRTRGSRGAIAVDYATTDGTARAPSDYATTAGTLNWADGDTTPKTIFVPILADGANEGAEFLVLTLTNPTNEAILGAQATAQLVIAPSDGAGPGIFTDEDGDLVTVRLTPKTGAGTLKVYLTDTDGDGDGPIEWIDLIGTTSKSVVTITVGKPRGGTGDLRVELGSVTGGDLKTLSAPRADLTGDGLRLTGRLGSARVGDLFNKADIIAAGADTDRTTLVVGTVGDGSTIQLGSRLNRLVATAIGDATVTAPSAGTIRVRGDLGGDITISGAGVATDRPALRTLSVGGTIRDSLISVGGNITSVIAAGFDGSRLYAGYTETGGFNLSATVGTVRVTGKTNAFANSRLYATEFKAVVLMSVDADNGGTLFGVYADEKIGRVTVPGELKYPGQSVLGDFRVEVV